MKLTRLALSALAVFAVCVFFASLVHAQATRTRVSGVGDDANPCSRTAPCKTFAGAISKTAPGGEINCLDPGGFGAVTITKAITIDCLHTLGGVLAAFTNGVNVHAAASDRVVLRGLDINGAGSGLTGIVFASGGSLHVENSVIYGMQNGINIGAGNEVYIKNTYIRNNSNFGVYIASPGLVNAVIEKTTVENQAYGLVAGANARVTTRGSVYSGNSNSGILAQGGSSAAQVNVDSCIVTNNGVGLYSGGQGALRVASSFISGNNLGVATGGSGIAATFFDNKLQGNTLDGGFNLGLTTN
ncbi:MAG TPA: right-handed parallel beta-helix repeat-containing protein [Candidatus Binatia bacterium]|nr:right-handed parallel beta-helix repeat-containing protein [Candidatus Binatia bacterium]